MQEKMAKVRGILSKTNRALIERAETRERMTMKWITRGLTRSILPHSMNNQNKRQTRCRESRA
jgi:hypothetical protein